MPKLKNSITTHKTRSLQDLPTEVKEILICASNTLYTGVADLWLNSRDREIVDARHIAITLIWENYGSHDNKKGYTLKRLGRFFNRHHSTIIIALRKSRNLIECDDIYRDKYQRVKNNAGIIQKRPDITRFIEIIELLNRKNAIEAEDYLLDLLNKQTIELQETS